jgi:hypothetical protein
VCGRYNALRRSNLLNKSVATAATGIVLLKLDKLEIAKGLKYSLKIVLSDVEMNVSNVEAMERNRVGVSATRLGVPGLAVLLRLSDLNNDGNAEELLASDLQCLGHGFFVLKFDVTDSANG